VRRLKVLEENQILELHTLLGSAYADQHEYATAIKYRKSLAIDPAQRQTHYLLVRL
jgi:hypothetical protein